MTFPVTMSAKMSTGEADVVAQARLRFRPPQGFRRSLKLEVDDYFRTTGRRPRDTWQLYLKCAVVLAGFVASYIMLVFVVRSWWTAALFTCLTGIFLALTSFNILHDAAHGALSNRPRVNRAFSLLLDVQGVSSYVWMWKHNTLHHTYTNVHGGDDDIELGMLARLSKDQPRYGFHRAQRVYLWAAYGLMTMKWHLFDDFWTLAIGRIGEHQVPRPRGGDLAVLLGGKTLFLGWAFILPATQHPWLLVIAAYLCAAFVCGVLASVTFQLAHCVEGADFPRPSADGVLANDWAVHQVETTVDFAPRNAVVTWLLGGLNFQIEHHLFPKISHVHYPALAPIVERVCRAYGVRYTKNDTLRAALRSHYRFLARMGAAD